jgi:hypothetical protein
MESLALAITRDEMQMPLPGPIGTPGFRGPEVTNFIEVYEWLASGAGINRAAVDVIAMFPHYRSGMIHKTIRMRTGYLRMD